MSSGSHGSDPSDPQVAARVAEALQDMGAIERARESWLQQAPSGLAPELPDRDDAWCEQRYQLARQLSDENKFQLAMPLALQLVGARPADARFSFLAGSCLQRLGLLTEAARMYAFSTLGHGASAVTLYRLGECWIGLGDTQAATHAFEEAFSLARDEAEGRVVQDMATQALERLKRRAAKTA
jgi:tetratricopeptide (TPR) repeat protein